MIAKFDTFLIRKALFSDARQLYEISQNIDVMRFYGTPPFMTYDAARDEIHWFHTLERSKTGFRWVICDLKNQCIGTLGVFNFNVESKTVEISYQLKRSLWGKGIMSQALDHMVKICFKDYPYQHLIAYIHKENINSINLVNRLGFNKVINFKPKSEDVNRLKDCNMYLLSKKED